MTSWLKEEGFQTSLRTINQVGAPHCCRSVAGTLDYRILLGAITEGRVGTWGGTSKCRDF